MPISHRATLVDLYDPVETNTGGWVTRLFRYRETRWGSVAYVASTDAVVAEQVTQRYDAVLTFDAQLLVTAGMLAIVNGAQFGVRTVVPRPASYEIEVQVARVTDAVVELAGIPRSIVVTPASVTLDAPTTPVSIVVAPEEVFLDAPVSGAGTVGWLETALAVQGVTIDHLWLTDTGVTQAGGYCTAIADARGGSYPSLPAYGRGCKWDAATSSIVRDDIASPSFGMLRTAPLPALDYNRVGGFALVLGSSIPAWNTLAVVGDNASTPVYTGQNIGNPMPVSVGVYSPSTVGLAIQGFSTEGSGAMTVANPMDPEFLPSTDLRAMLTYWDRSTSRVGTVMMGDTWGQADLATYTASNPVTFPDGDNRLSVFPADLQVGGGYDDARAQAIGVLAGVTADNAIEVSRIWEEFYETRFPATAKKLTGYCLQVDGDSISLMYADNVPPVSYGDLLASRLGARCKVHAVGGWSWANLHGYGIDDPLYQPPLRLDRYRNRNRKRPDGTPGDLLLAWEFTNNRFQPTAQYDDCSTYLAQRIAAGWAPENILIGTSLSDCDDVAGDNFANRDAFDVAMMARAQAVDGDPGAQVWVVVPMHTDTDIGVEGANEADRAGQPGGHGTYFWDCQHMNGGVYLATGTPESRPGIGTAKIADIWEPYVSARMALD